MKDVQINTFEKGMQKDLGATVPQPGSYTHAENIRIISDGDVGENAIAVSVNGNKQVVHIQYSYEVPNEIQQEGNEDASEGGQSSSGTTVLQAPCKIIGYTTIRNTLITFSKVTGIGAQSSLIHATDLSTLPDSVEIQTGVSVTTNAPTDNTELIYESYDLNFSLNNPIQAIGIYESENIQRIYWTDNINPVRTLNIKDDLTFITPPEFDLEPVISFPRSPKITNINSNGKLPAGSYSYAYRFSNFEGAVTTFSPITHFIPILSGTQYWAYEEDPENQIEYSNITPGEITDKAVELSIDIQDVNNTFDHIEVAAIYQTNVNVVSDVYIIEKRKIGNSGKQSFTHKNNTGTPITIEEVTSFQSAPDIAKCITTKDNRLFLGNVKYKNTELLFNARSYRYKRNDNVIYPHTQKTAEGANVETSTYISDITFNESADPYDYINLNSSDFEGQFEYAGIRQLYDSYNPYNAFGKQQTPAGLSYKFNESGRDLGGSGVNVSYKFKKRKLNGNEFSSVPDQAPFVTGVFAPGTGCGDTVGAVKGDYKSPQNVMNYVGYQRDEIYRFGIVLYDLKGKPGFVNWIDDIRFPDYHDIDRYPGSDAGYLPNYTLSQNFQTNHGGTNYNWNENEPDAYAFMNYYDPDNAGNYDNVESSYDNDDPEFGSHYSSDLYVLGLEFTVDLPHELKSQVSGYSIVRVERKQNDKTVLGSGIINFLERFSMHGEIFSGFGPQNLYYMKGGDSGAQGDRYNFQMTIDSPDFNFNDDYPSGSCNYLKIGGAFVGETNADFTGTNDSGSEGHTTSATVLTAHKLANTKDYFGRTYEILHSSKFGRGADLNIDLSAHFDNEGFFNFNNSSAEYSITGFKNKAFDVVSASNIQIRSIGEESLLVVINPFQDALGVDTEYFDPNATIPWDEWLPYSPLQQDRVGKDAKLLGVVKTELHSTASNDLLFGGGSTQYGGNTYAARASNIYISTGHYATVDTLGESQEVWGGDTYVTLYDLEKVRKYSSGLGDSGSTGSTIEHSKSYAFPVETTVNTTLRGGWHFANKTDWGFNTEQELNTFELEPVYSNINNIETFLPKPLNFVDNETIDTRVVYSDVKSNNQSVDNWRNFKLENYADVEGLYGSLEKLVLKDDIMYFLQKSAFGKFSINPVSTVLDEAGASIVLGTGDVIQDVNYISTNIGCSNFLSVVSSPVGIYWFDSNAKKAYAFRANGLESISDTHGVKSWFAAMYRPQSYTSGLLSDTTLMNKDVVLGYDYLNSEVLFSLRTDAVNYTETPHYGTTIAFSENINKFTSIYTYYTPMYMSLPDRLLSIDSNLEHRGEIFQHNIGAITKWFKVPGEHKIEFIVNKNSLYPKAFDHIEWFVSKNNNDTIYTNLGDNFSEASFRVSSPSELVTETFGDGFNIVEDSDFDIRENISRLPVPRNSSGERLRDTYIKITLKRGVSNLLANYKIALHYVKTFFRISKR